MKITKLLLVIFSSITIAACGGGGGGGDGGTSGGGASGGGNVSGTAAQYFTKKAVGNTWSYLNTYTTTAGQPASTTTLTHTNKMTITASTGSAVTYSNIFTSNSVITTFTGTDQIDATGAWVSNNTIGAWLLDSELTVLAAPSRLERLGFRNQQMQQRGIVQLAQWLLL